VLEHVRTCCVRCVVHRISFKQHSLIIRLALRACFYA
jgi:hypothetical protein